MEALKQKPMAVRNDWAHVALRGGHAPAPTAFYQAPLGLEECTLGSDDWAYRYHPIPE